MSSTQPTALVVDDIEKHRKLLVRYLRDHYQIIEADSGEQCLSTLEQAAPDVIFLNALMPGISGDDVCYNLKRIPETRDIPVVFLCDLSREVFERSHGEIIADIYLVKPVKQRDIDELISKL